MILAPVLALIKISTLVYYRRIFVVSPTFCFMCNILMALTVGWFLTCIFGSLLTHVRQS